MKYTKPEINIVLTDIFFRSFSFLSSFIHTESKTVHLYVGRKVLDFICNIKLNERSGKKGIVLLVFCSILHSSVQVASRHYKNRLPKNINCLCFIVLFNTL